LHTTQSCSALHAIPVEPASPPFGQSDERYAQPDAHVAPTGPPETPSMHRPVAPHHPQFASAVQLPQSA
jgi:hypothetical protein